MKTLSTLILIISLLSLVSCDKTESAGPQTDVPEAVLKQLEVDHPNAKDLRWMEHGHYFIAEFMENDMEVEVSYDASGVPVYTEAEINSSDLPVAITNSLNETHPGISLSEASRSVRPEGTFYEVEFNEGDKEIELNFDVNGNRVSEGSDDDEGDDDDYDDDDK